MNLSLQYVCNASTFDIDKEAISVQMHSKLQFVFACLEGSDKNEEILDIRYKKASVALRA